MSLSSKLSIKDVELKGKKVLIRVDYNVPMDGGKITNNQVSHLTEPCSFGWMTLGALGLRRTYRTLLCTSSVVVSLVALYPWKALTLGSLALLAHIDESRADPSMASSPFTAYRRLCPYHQALP